jgi:hypothetical protein
MLLKAWFAFWALWCIAFAAIPPLDWQSAVLALLAVYWLACLGREFSSDTGANQ